MRSICFLSKTIINLRVRHFADGDSLLTMIFSRPDRSLTQWLVDPTVCRPNILATATVCQVCQVTVPYLMFCRSTRNETEKKLANCPIIFIMECSKFWILIQNLLGFSSGLCPFGSRTCGEPFNIEGGSAHVPTVNLLHPIEFHI